MLLFLDAFYLALLLRSHFRCLRSGILGLLLWSLCNILNLSFVCHDFLLVLPFQFKLGIESKRLELVHHELECVADLDEIDLHIIAADRAIRAVLVLILDRDDPAALAHRNHGLVGVESLFQEKRGSVRDKSVLLHLSKPQTSFLGPAFCWLAREKLDRSSRS